MLQALTDRERRTLLAILAVLALGAAVKLWRWKAEQRVEPVQSRETQVSSENAGRRSTEIAFAP